MCCPLQSNIGCNRCIHFVVVSLQHLLQGQGFTTLMGDKNSVMCCWHCRHVFLFRNIYMWLASSLASASKTWPRPRGSGLDLGIGLRVLTLASYLALAIWPCLTSLVNCNIYLFCGVLNTSQDCTNFCFCANTLIYHIACFLQMVCYRLFTFYFDMSWHDYRLKQAN